MSDVFLIPCPICRSENDFYPVNITDTDFHIRKYGDLYAGKEKSEWQVCGNCGFVHQNPRPSVEALNQFYLTSNYHPPESPDAWQTPDNYLEFAHWYYDEKIDYALKQSGLSQGAVFDVGFGQGGLLRMFADRGWQAFGVESDSTFLNYARNKLGLGLIQEGILDSGTEVDAKVDLVVSNHTFEHIADLHDAMAGLLKVLKPGGYVFTAIPTYYQNRSRISLEWMNSAHYSMFTHSSLNQLFSHYGLEEVSHTYRGWRKEIDDLWHVARFTGNAKAPTTFYEDAKKVRRYINTVNPLRSIVWYPLYSNYPRRVRIYEKIKHRLIMLRYYGKMLLSSPQLFISKSALRLKARMRHGS